MNVLLDTHVWVWSQEQLEKLGPEATLRLDEPATRWYVSPISTLEICRLVAAGKVRVGDGDLERWVADSVSLLRCTTLDVSHAISIEAYALPGSFHEDPADRILVATARVHALTLATADQKILDYPHVETLDVRR